MSEVIRGPDTRNSRNRGSRARCATPASTTVPPDMWSITSTTGCSSRPFSRSGGWSGLYPAFSRVGESYVTLQWTGLRPAADLGVRGLSPWQSSNGHAASASEGRRAAYWLAAPWRRDSGAHAYPPCDTRRDYRGRRWAGYLLVFARVRNPPSATTTGSNPWPTRRWAQKWFGMGRELWQEA
jgi:hypothetical protein